MIVVIGQDGLDLVPQVEKELNIASCSQHRAGIELMGIGHDQLDLAYQGFADSLVLVAGIYREQADDAHTGHGPEAHGTDDRSFIFSDQNVLLPRIFFQALEGLGCPAADGVDRGIFAEGGLLHLENCGKICFGRWSNVHHGVASGSGTRFDVHNGMKWDSQGCLVGR